MERKVEVCCPHWEEPGRTLDRGACPRQPRGRGQHRSMAGAGEELLGLPEKSWPPSVPGSSFQGWSPFGPQIRASSLHNLFLGWRSYSGDLLEWLKSMVMQTQQLKYGDYNGHHRWLPPHLFKRQFTARHAPSFPLMHIPQAETQPPGFDSGMARTERLSRKSETALSEL